MQAVCEEQKNSAAVLSAHRSILLSVSVETRTSSMEVMAVSGVVPGSQPL